MHHIQTEAARRILLLDGAMATQIQPLQLTETDFRNPDLINHTIELKGNNDLLNITRPEVIRQIHLEYLEAGADIISTNTFGANRISQEDYKLADYVTAINVEGVKRAKEAVASYLEKNPGKPLFIAGSMGPTTKLASLSPDVNNPGYRSVTFDQLAEAYTEQAMALIEGGVDLFLLETITDTLNAKAALFALMTIFETTGKAYPIMVSGTITDASGRILSGQTVEAFLVAVSHAPLLSVGLNCALGAKELRPYLEVLHKTSPFLVSTHPNAGLPNQFGSYDQSAAEFAVLVGEFAANGWLNIVGGCCGTTPAHIAAAAEAISNQKPRSMQLAVKVKNKFRMEPVAAGKSNTMDELLALIAGIEEEATFYEVKQIAEATKGVYHPEQLMLIQARLFARYNYLRVENKLERKRA